MDTHGIVSEIQNVLGGLRFPLHKDEAVAQAEQKGASPEAKQALSQLPAQDFASLQELVSKLPLSDIEGALGKFL